MPKRIELKPPWPWASKFRIAQGLRIGDTVYTSGQVAFDPDGNVVGAGDAGAQTRQIFENIRVVLAEASATLDDVVKITAFLTDMNNYAAFSAARAEAFPNNIPASTAVSTPSLVMPEFLVEVEAIAVIGGGG